MKKDTEIEKKKLVPPYLNVAKLEKLFELLSTRSFIQFTVNDFTTRGFSKPDSFLALQTLKFLDLITPENKAKESIRLFAMKGEERSQQLQDLVKVAYKKMFDTNPNAEKLDKDGIFNELMAIYGISPRLATPATAAFIWLCNKVGLETKETIISRPKKGFSKIPFSKGRVNIIPTKTTLRNPQESTQDYLDLNIADTGIRLLIPKNEKVDDAVMSGALLEARAQLIKFAKFVGLGGKEEVSNKAVDSVDGKN